MADPKKPGSPFASLASLRAALPPGPEPKKKEAPKRHDPFAGKIVVAHTRRGRGGKTVTTVTGILASAATLEPIARELRHALGCGATLEGAVIVVQGDQVERVRAWLEGRGAGRIVLGTR